MVEPYSKPWRLPAIALCLLWYWLLILEFNSPVVHAPDGIGLTFNSMMDHLLQGRFDVDPATVQKEGFLRDGRVYAYWGIFCALLRLPLMPFDNGLNWDITRLSCAIAASGIFLVNYRSWRFLEDRGLLRHVWLSRCLFLALALSGVQICFLESSLYQEVCLWAGLFGLWFVHWALRACIDPAETGRALPRMALAAGLALLTRVSMGIGLYAALGLFLLLLGWRWWIAGGKAQGVRSAAAAWVAAALLAVLFVAVAALVNYGRWGSPLTFADYSLYIMNADYPDRLPRTQAYGLFNVERIPLGLVYFFFPVWAFTAPNGKLFLEDAFHRLIDAAELPPSSFFLTDGFLILLCAALFMAVLRRRDRPVADMAGAAVIGVGLALAAAMMLMAISMNYRYRIEFYPVLIFGALIGAVALGRMAPERARAWRRWAIPLVMLGMVSSHLVLALYKIGDFGPGWMLLGDGIVAYYGSKL